MKKIIKLCMTVLLCSCAASATDTTYKANTATFQLHNKNGSFTPYVLKKNEIAVIGNKNISLVQEGNAKELLHHPSYTLFRMNEKGITAFGANKNTMIKTQAGLVFYEYGKEDSSHRYITTGTVLVVFKKDTKVNFEKFAIQNHLKYLQTISDSGAKIVLFLNASDKNDLELASSLMQQSAVTSSKPNWILPLKLL